MHDDLIGYLLGALEQHEMRAVGRRVQCDPEAAAELERLRQLLQIPRPIDRDSSGGDSWGTLDETPSADLVSRTLAKLPSRRGAVDRQPPETRELLPSLTPASRSASERDRGSWRDWFATVTAVGLLAAIVVPSLVEGRFEARRRACENHLRELGVAMTQFVNRNAEARLPSVPREGHRAFAGIYSPQLRTAGLLQDATLITCPSVESESVWDALYDGSLKSDAIGWAANASSTRQRDGSGTGTSEQSKSVVVTMEALDQAAADVAAMTFPRRGINPVERLRRMQQLAGGHYAFTLGVRNGDHFAAPRFQGRSSFAVLSDAALSHSGDASSRSSASGHLRVISHSGRGINVLFEDGRVQFLPTRSLGSLPDHPLINHEGRVEAGLTIDDATLAPSWQPPFIDSSQR